MSLRVLITHEHSGTVRDAFLALGHDAHSNDLLPDDQGSPRHIQGDCFDAIARGPWDLIGLHPDCTFLTVAGIHWNNRGRGWEKTTAALEHVRKCIAACADVPWYLENPVSIISTHIRKPDQTIQPYEYGEDASKRTCLWLNKLPKLVPTQYFPPRLVCMDCGYTFKHGLHKCPDCGSQEFRPRWSNQTDSGQNRLGPSDDRWKLRSKTYPLVAAAMADQWSKFLS